MEQEFEKATVVFEGRAESVETLSSQLPAPVEGLITLTFRGKVRSFRFHVLRVHKGPSESSFTILTGSGGGDCGVGFEVGRKYLVYAHGEAGRSLSTSICTRTQPLEEANADLRYLNGEPPTEEDLLTPRELWRRSTATLCGRVSRLDGNSLVDPAVYLWKTTAPYEKEEWFERPESDGSYCIEFVEPGGYQLSAVDRTRLGRLRYVGLYGGETGTIVETERGQTIRGLDIRLKPQQVHQISGRVVTEDGTHIDFEHVEIKATHALDTPFAYLDFIEPRSDGSFVIPRAPEGRIRLLTYMSEFVDRRWATTETYLAVDTDKKNVTIVLKRKRPGAD